MIHKPPSTTRILAESPLVTFTGPIAFDAQDAATYLEGFPESERHDQVRRLLELGTQVAGLIQTSTTLKLVEAQITAMTEGLTKSITSAVQKDRETASKLVRDLLDDHRAKVTNSLTRYLDPDSQASIPVVMAKTFDKAGEALLKRVENLLSEGNDSALGRLSERFTKELDTKVALIIEQIAAKRALTTRSTLAGRPYEDYVEDRVLTLARALGDAVVRCGDNLGQLRRKNGDIVINISPDAVNGQTDVKIVLEAKRRGEAAPAFSANEIKDSLSVARRNRGAAAGLFVTESAALLPLGIGFHEYGGSNIAVSFDPMGEDTGLAVAYRLLRFTVVQEARGSAGDQLDREAYKRVVADIRSAMTKLETIRAQHQSAMNAITKASSVATELTDAVIRGLRQLDDLME